MASPSAALCMNPHCAGGAFIFSLDAQNPINLGHSKALSNIFEGAHQLGLGRAHCCP